MSRHDDHVTLRQMLDFARQGRDWAAERSRADLVPGSLETLGLIKLVENIGEAAGRVSTQMRDRSQDVPWGEIMGTRHRLVHGYDRVDLEVLWTILSRDLAHLVRALERTLSELPA